MRYRALHKQQTHGRIVSRAARLFREAGYEGSGVDAVMSAAGLTAGGFYSHFKSKDALLAEALEHCLVESAQRLSRPTADGSDPLIGLIDRYLSPRHRNSPGMGCPLPTLAGEIPRQKRKVRTAFTGALRRYLAMLGKELPGNTPDERLDRAIALLASLAGAMLLARAVDDDKLSDRILQVMRRTASTSAATHSRSQPVDRRTRIE